ncbi:putative tRNA pseudouridine synthase Pus10 [Blattamonas nauphoetae]|uniref:tRNA pseudouridine(55) synthase n=1 Tax=Blattamonas nauphoetae TaxID=2049346 RepID=A0ABQ9Y031_9EUKA|nr:putative tRNA pseudouridine synthase Pus10 [Blattamonas nauphoetae]
MIHDSLFSLVTHRTSSLDNHVLLDYLSILNKMGMCSRCLLCFLNLRDQALHFLPTHILEQGLLDKLVPILPDLKFSRESCVCCLGTMHACGQDNLDSIVQDQLLSTFTGVTHPLPINISYSLPPALCFREFGIALSLPKVEALIGVLGEGQWTSFDGDLKTISRNLIIHRLEQNKLFQVVADARVRMNFALDFSDTSALHSCDFIVSNAQKQQTEHLQKRAERQAKWKQKEKEKTKTSSEQPPSSEASGAPLLKEPKSVAFFTNTILRQALQNPPLELMRRNDFLPPTVHDNWATTLKVTSLCEPVLIAGEYNKFSRLLPQTPWRVAAVGGEDDEDSHATFESSTQEEIDKAFIPLFQAESSLFHSAGREDVDVRMLGNGRPFCLELVNCKRLDVTDSDLASAAAQLEMEGLVKINNPHFATQAIFMSLKEGETHKRKEYTAVVWTSAPQTPESLSRLSLTEPLQVSQLTPIRVLHRRSLDSRQKVVYSMHTTFINPHYFVLALQTSAGTYVKEFVHGDLGRTNPNVGGLLGCEADILQLDVTDLIPEK